jgi:hypothetical protein
MVSDECADALYLGTRITALNYFLIAIKDASLFDITRNLHGYMAILKHSAFARRQQNLFCLSPQDFIFRTDCGEMFTLPQRRFLLTEKEQPVVMFGDCSHKAKTLCRSGKHTSRPYLGHLI